MALNPLAKGCVRPGTSIVRQAEKEKITKGDSANRKEWRKGDVYRFDDIKLPLLCFPLREVGEGREG